MTMNRRLKGALLGALGGALGTAVMGAYMSAFSRIIGGRKSGEGPKPEAPSISLVGPQFEAGERANEAAGRIVYESVADTPPSPTARKAMSQAVHWGFGIGMGALYGAARPEATVPDTAGGLVFGTAVWLVASELLVPLLGLSPAPTENPVSSHLEHMTAHFLYGLVTSSAAQGLREWASGDSPSTPPPAMTADEGRLELQQFGAAI
jgi:hypothetical protein